MAFAAASTTGVGVPKSGSPTSRCTIDRPARSAAQAASMTSTTRNGVIVAVRRASGGGIRPILGTNGPPK